MQTIVFSGGVCSGGHGLSIGSVGGRSDNTVSGVTFENSEVKDSVNGSQGIDPQSEHKLIMGTGIRIKATEGDTGTIKSVTYSGITLESISG